MFECMTAFMVPEHLAGMSFVPPEGPAGYSRLMNEFRRPFRTRDGHLSVVPYTGAQWGGFFTLAGAAEVVDDPRYATQAARSRHCGELYAFVEDIVRQRSTAEWTALLQDADIPFAPVNSIAMLLDDPHLNAVGFWREIDHPTEGRLKQAGTPIYFSRTPTSVRRHAPVLGEHTAEFLDKPWA